jgi:hypothetical protein
LYFSLGVIKCKKELSPTSSALLIGIFTEVPFSDLASTEMNKLVVGPVIFAVPLMNAVQK